MSISSVNDNSLVTAETRSLPHRPSREGIRPLTGAHGIHRIQTLFVNCYLVDAGDGRWALIDAGLPGFAGLIKLQAQRHYDDIPPSAIVLTHGHFDHVGSVAELADFWDVPVYCHQLEAPYLDGRSNYPPQDPTVGGAIAMLSRGFPHSGHDLEDRLRILPDDGSVPGLPEWTWLHTPGHTAGHISLFRERDRALISGDAVVSMDLDSWSTQLSHRRQLSRPPAPMTTDWDLARQSVEKIAACDPLLLFTGHGAPLYGSRLPSELSRLQHTLEVPVDGRYGRRPATADANGLTSVPPPVADPLPRRLLALALLGLGAYAGKELWNRRKTQPGR